MQDSDKTDTSHFSLNLKNVQEQVEPIRLKVKGSIPYWLTGKLYRIGPGTYDIPLKNGGTYHAKHWFNGFGMVHSFEIKDGGEVWYRNRKTAQHMEDAIAETGEVSTITFAPTDPCESTFHKFFTFFKRSIPGFGRSESNPGKNTNVSVTLTPNRPGVPDPEKYPARDSSKASYLVGQTDADANIVLDPETLEVLTVYTYGKLHPDLEGGALAAAHSCSDPVTGDFFNFVTKFGWTPCYKIFRIRGSGPQRGKVDVLATITDAPITYIHSSCLTEKYYILCVWQADIRG
jgi:torulene dioxygenase